MKNHILCQICALAMTAAILLFGLLFYAFVTWQWQWPLPWVAEWAPLARFFVFTCWAIWVVVGYGVANDLNVTDARKKRAKW